MSAAVLRLEMGQAGKAHRELRKTWLNSHIRHTLFYATGNEFVAFCPNKFEIAEEIVKAGLQGGLDKLMDKKSIQIYYMEHTGSTS